MTMPQSQPEEIQFTREQFYEKVWSQPATAMSEELGVPAVLIAKACKDHGIPNPYPGYWTQLRCGKKPKQKRLPATDDPALQTIAFNKTKLLDSLPGKPDTGYDPDIQQILDKALNLAPITVPDSLRNPHPLIVETRRWIKINRIHYSERTDEMRSAQPSLAIDVSQELTGRALGIMNTIIRTVNKVGGAVEVRNESGHRRPRQTVVCLAGEAIAIRLREKKTQVRLTAKEREDWFAKQLKLVPTGRLLLEVGAVQVCDTAGKRRIEDGLNKLVVRMVKLAAQTRAQRHARETARAKREADERLRRQREAALQQQRADLTRRQADEQRNVDELRDHADGWRQSQLIRNYLDALSQKLVQRDEAIDLDGEAARYLRWAHQQADRLDPLRPSPASILDEQTGG